MDILKKIIDSALGLMTKYVFPRCLFISFLFSSAAWLMVGTMMGVFFQDKDNWLKVGWGNENDIRPIFVGLMFLVTWVLLSWVTYLSVMKELADVYSWLRDKIMGTWNLQFQTWRINDEGKWARATVNYTSKLSVKASDGKLTAEIKQFGHDFFEDMNSSTDIVHVYGSGMNYEILSIFDIVQTVRDDIGSKISGESFNMKILVIFNIKTSPGENLIHMDGTWYDIENVMWRVIERHYEENRAQDLWNELEEGVYNFKGDVYAQRI